MNASDTPLIWVLRLPRPVRLLAWVVVFGLTVAAGHKLSISLLGGVLMVLAVVGIQLSVVRSPRLPAIDEEVGEPHVTSVAAPARRRINPQVEVGWRFRGLGAGAALLGYSRVFAHRRVGELFA